MTLGSMVMTRGIALMIANGSTVNLGPRGDDFFFLGGGFIFGVPTPIWVFALVCLAAFGLVVGYVDADDGRWLTDMVPTALRPAVRVIAGRGGRPGRRGDRAALDDEGTVS